MVLHEIFAEEQIGFPILSLLIFLPIVLAVLLTVIKDESVLRVTALLGALVELGLSVVLVARFIPGSSDNGEEVGQERVFRLHPGCWSGDVTCNVMNLWSPGQAIRRLEAQIVFSIHAVLQGEVSCGSS